MPTPSLLRRASDKPPLGALALVRRLEAHVSPRGRPTALSNCRLGHSVAYTVGVTAWALPMATMPSNLVPTQMSGSQRTAHGNGNRVGGKAPIELPSRLAFRTHQSGLSKRQNGREKIVEDRESREFKGNVDVRPSADATPTVSVVHRLGSLRSLACGETCRHELPRLSRVTTEVPGPSQLPRGTTTRSKPAHADVEPARPRASKAIM